MRIKHKVVLTVSEDTDQKNLLFATDEDLAEVTVDAYEKQVSGLVKVLAGATESVLFGDVATPKGLYLRLNGDAQVNLNGLGLMQLRRSSTGASVVCKLFLEADITSIAIKAPDGSDVSGVFCIWGDAAS